MALRFCQVRLMARGVMRNQLNCFIVYRHFNASEAASSLRPFYFLVHPDLFAQYPEIKNVNENSLKLLHEHLNVLEREPAMAKMERNPLKLTFYLRPAKAEDKIFENAFKMVKFDLNPQANIYSTVLSILRHCDLPTDHLHTADQSRTYAQSAVLPEDWTAYDNEQLKIFWQRKADHKPVDIKTAIKNLHAQSELNKEAHAILLLEVNQSIQQLKNITGLSNVFWDSDWTLAHCRGAVLALKRALDQWGSSPGGSLILPRGLINKTIRFGSKGTFLALDGSLNMGLDDVPEQWLKLVRLVGNTQTGFKGLFLEVDKMEKELSLIFGGAKVTGNRMCETSVLKYLSWLRQLIHQLKSPARFYLEIFTGPDVCIFVQSESGSCMLGTGGEIFVPANCDPERLKEFLNENIPISKSVRLQRRKNREILEVALELCKKRFKLARLSWEENLLTPQEMIDCLDRLEENETDSEFCEILENLDLHFSRRTGYTVLPDGRISVPIDWV